MHFSKIKVTVVKVNARKASASPMVEPQVRSGHEFVDADDAFYRAVVAEIKLRRPRTKAVGKLYQKLRQWSWESDKMNWGLIMTRCGASAHLEEFSDGVFQESR